MTPSMSITPIFEPTPKPSSDAESPLMLLTVDQTMAVMSSAMRAKQPPITATQNHGERRGRGGLPGRTAARTNRPPTSAPKRARCGHGDRFAVADALHEAVVRMLTSER